MLMVNHRFPATHYRLVPYDPRWPAMFKEEKARVLDAAGKIIIAVEHMGSTAVPGLSAKPVIDMIGGVKSLPDALQCVEALAGVGHEYRLQFEAADPGRRYFRKGPSGQNTHHLSLVEHLGQRWKDYLLFRDYLRTHPQTAQEYSELKKELLEKFGLRAEPVENARKAFVERVLAVAQH